MKIFETHAHLDFDAFNKDRDQVIRRSLESGVKAIVNVGVNAAGSRASIALAERWDHIWAAVGFHPADADAYDPGLVKDLLRHPRVVALGEIGLDYYRDYTPRDLQRRVFEQQLGIAVECEKPVIVHCREAHDDCWDILAASGAPYVVFHCYSGDEAFAERAFDRGWHVSFTGTITYKNSDQSNLVRSVPRDRFFVETDCPYLTPHPYRGKRNAPYRLPLVVERIAELKGLPPKAIAEQTWINAARFFRLDKLLYKV